MSTWLETNRVEQILHFYPRQFFVEIRDVPTVYMFLNNFDWRETTENYDYIVKFLI